MTFQEFIEYGATLSVMVVAVVDSIKYGFLKAYFKNAATKFSWTTEQAQTYYVAALTGLSILVGFLVAMGAGERANILTQLGFHSVAPVMGYILTGFMLAFGNVFFSTVMDTVKGTTDAIRVWRDKQSAGLYDDEPADTSASAF